MKNKKWLKGAAVLLIAVMAFAGCSGGGGSSNRAEKALSEFLSKVDRADNFDEAAFNEIVKDISPESFATVLKGLSSEVQTIALTFSSSELIGAASNFFSASPGGDFTFELNGEGNGIVITSYTGRNPIVVFPSVIESYPVVEIAGRNNRIAPNEANSFIISVVLPDGVENISGFSNQRQLRSIDLSRTSITMTPSFSGCRNLRTVKLPETVTVISNSSFSGCSSLTDINIPANTKIIGQNAFTGCGELFNLSIPDSITAIDFPGSPEERLFHGFIPARPNNAFVGCSKLPIATRQRLQALGYTDGF
jgi:hypothetical protein